MHVIVSLFLMFYFYNYMSNFILQFKGNIENANHSRYLTTRVRLSSCMLVNLDCNSKTLGKYFYTEILKLPHKESSNPPLVPVYSSTYKVLPKVRRFLTVMSRLYIVMQYSIVNHGTLYGICKLQNDKPTEKQFNIFITLLFF